MFPVKTCYRQFPSEEKSIYSINPEDSNSPNLCGGLLQLIQIVQCCRFPVWRKPAYFVRSEDHLMYGSSAYSCVPSLRRCRCGERKGIRGFISLDDIRVHVDKARTSRRDSPFADIFKAVYHG